MGNVIGFTDYIDYTIDSFSGEDPNWTASNVKIFEKQFRPWKTLDTNDNWMILNLLAPRQVNGVVLINPNYTSFKIQGNSTNVFTAPAFDTGLQDIFRDRLRGRYSSFKNPQKTAAFNLQYVRIFIPAQATTDGDTKFKTGGVIVSINAEEFQENPSQGFRVRPTRAAEKVRGTSGADEISNRGERLAELEFEMEATRNASDFDKVTRLIFDIDQDKPLILAANGTFIEEEVNDQFVYVVKRVGDPSYTIAGYELAVIQGITLREQS